MLTQDGKLQIAYDNGPVCILPSMANRHGLVAGATGTGKTTTLKVLSETFSDAGIPVFFADIKGDVSGLATAGDPTNENVAKRVESMQLEGFTAHGCPVRFWDVYGEKGIPIRTTISEMGPLLLSRILGLTDVQSGVMEVVFRIADDKELLLVDLKDLRAMLQHVGDHAKEYAVDYGNVATASVGAIQRSLVQLENAGGEMLFGEPSVEIQDWIQCDADGRGIINILDCTKLALSPLLYSTFMLWMLSELYENMPEVGDEDKPRIVFIFDEAHMLFDGTSKAMVDKVEQVIKLIRSKGVGVYFCTQSPTDISNSVLAQLNNRIQHGLRAYTPAEQKNIRAAAASFRENPDFDTATVLQELKTGEALISCLDETGAPSMVQRAMILPPQCSFSPLPDWDRQTLLAADRLYPKYQNAVDPRTAYEVLSEQFAEEQAAKEEAEALKAQEKAEREAKKKAAEEARAEAAEKRAKQAQRKQVDDVLDIAIKTTRFIKTARGILGTSKK